MSSGLVVTDSKDENVGAVHSFYDEKKEEYGFLYPEITGYFISSMRFLHSVEKNLEYVKLAKNSSDWLIGIENKFGGIIQGLSKEKTQEKLVYSFDTAICATGILDCYLLTKDEKYLKFAKKLTEWISNEAVNKNGEIKPVKNLTTNQFIEDKNLWYKQSGCLHLKTAIPFLKLYEITSDEKDLVLARKILDQFSLFQNSDGSLSLHKGKSTIHLHSLCYALEGLMLGYHFSQDKKYLELCEQALKWCILKIEKDNGINLWFNSSYQQAKTSYHIAQLIRLLILYDKAKGNQTFKDSTERLYQFMITLQNIEGNQNGKGVFYEEFYNLFLDGRKDSELIRGGLFLLYRL